MNRFKTLVGTIGVLTLAVVGFVVWIAVSALKAEERLIGVICTVRLVEEFMKQNDGEWPTSWDEIDSTPFQTGYYDTEEARNQLRHFAIIDFDTDLSLVARMNPDDFMLIRPNGPCSKSYYIQVASLIATAKELEAKKQKTLEKEDP